MNNEPVAWMASNELLFSVVKDEIYHIPLYTHPANLTDEEILVFEDANGNELKVDTGKWRLRKAQEK